MAWFLDYLRVLMWNIIFTLAMRYCFDHGVIYNVEENSFMEIVFAALIPTRHRPESLRVCLDAIYRNGVGPVITIVGDDSTDTECIQKNQKIVSMFCNCFYFPGKCKGPSQNRKDLVDKLLLLNENNRFGISHVAFVDDDIIISSKWFESASKFLYEDNARIPAENHIIYGPIVSSFDADNELLQLYRLTFLGHFNASFDGMTSCVNIQAAIFPLALFRKENFDPNIMFGYEDVDLCNRAIYQGFILDCVISMKAVDTLCGISSLAEGGVQFSALNLQIESARLYVTFKKYLCIEKSKFKAYYFFVIFFLHLIAHLVKTRNSIANAFLIYKKSKVWLTLKCSSHETRNRNSNIRGQS